MKYFSQEALEKIRNGYFTAVYFNRTKHILLSENNLRTVTMQVFQRKEGSILCGIEEAVEVLRYATGYYYSNPKSEIRNTKQIPKSNDPNSEWIDKWNDIKVMALRDGDRIKAGESVMHITGPYAYFAHLESIYLGILARRTMVATNTRCAVAAAKGKPVVFFADRFDYFLNQEGDGYAAHVGGASGVCTDAHTAWWGGKPSGTIPHAFIAVSGGSTIAAAEQFHKYYPKENLIVLADFENDCVKTSLEVAKRLGKKLWGVRLDTSSDMMDKSLEMQNEKFKMQNYNAKIKNKYYGVNPQIVRNVRNALNANGFKWVRIVVSGGFDAEKIRRFEDEQAPVDVYGVGTALLHGSNDFTADVVLVDGKPMAKVGRMYRENTKLRVVQLD